MCLLKDKLLHGKITDTFLSLSGCFLCLLAFFFQLLLRFFCFFGSLQEKTPSTAVWRGTDEIRVSYHCKKSCLKMLLAAP